MIFFVILIIIVIVVGAVYSSIQARKRREAFAAVAASLDMQYTSERDYSIDERYGFLKKLTQGSDRYAFNIIRGNYGGHPVRIFDYHYETYSTDSKGNRKTSHHYFSFFIFEVAANFPELVICREGFFSKVAQFFGYDDIDFESAEFSKKFLVRSSDKKFAYDFCNAQMIEFLLANQDLDIEVEQGRFHCFSLDV